MNIILPHDAPMLFALPCPPPLQDSAAMNVSLNLNTHTRMGNEYREMVDDSEVLNEDVNEVLDVQ